MAGLRLSIMMPLMIRGSVSRILPRNTGFPSINSTTNAFFMPPVNVANVAQCLSTKSDRAATHPQITSYNYCDIAGELAVPTHNRVLIDVRRDSERLATGTIPGSLHIPLHLVQEALARTERGDSGPGLRFPDKSVELIFFCRSGVRSAQAAELVMLAGWNKVGNYVGSWLDWEKRGGKVERIEADAADQP